MFNCKICGSVPSRTKQYKLVTKLRNVKYIYMIKVNKVGVKDKEFIPTIIDSYFKTIKISKGLEIANEDIYCSKCLPKKSSPEILKESVTKEVILKTVIEKERNKRFKRRYK